MIVYDQQDLIGEWVSAKVGGRWMPEGSVAIGQIDNGKITAGVIFDRYNFASIASTIAAEGQLSRKFVKAILHYPFNVAKVNCILNVVSSANTKSLALTQHFGFKQMAVIPNAYPDGDMHVFALTQDNCRKFMR